MGLGLILFLLQSRSSVFVSSTEGKSNMYLFLTGLGLEQEARYTMSLFRLFYGLTFTVPKWICLSRGQKKTNQQTKTNWSLCSEQNNYLAVKINNISAAGWIMDAYCIIFPCGPRINVPSAKWLNGFHR